MASNPLLVVKEFNQKLWDLRNSDFVHMEGVEGNESEASNAIFDLKGKKKLWEGVALILLVQAVYFTPAVNLVCARIG